VDAALRSTVAITGMELAYLSRVDATTFQLVRVHARSPWSGWDEGLITPREDSFCHRLLGGAPATTSDAAADPVYGTTPVAAAFGITSYVGVPVSDQDGGVFGTLCGIDRGRVSVADTAVPTLQELAGVVTSQLAPATTGPVIRRVGNRWSVDGGDSPPVPADDLTSAMVLADLLAAELGLLDGRSARPDKTDPDAGELARLRVSMAQLEHALAARVVVEQAIGVLSERRRVSPRAAFESLRSVARGSGRRVHDLAREVVASTSAPSPGDLPSSLARTSTTPSPAVVAKAVRPKP
jgi:hypothetical protein